MKGVVAVILIFLVLLGFGADTYASSVGTKYTNTIGMEFVKITAGTFIMGSPEDEPGRDGDESQHEVTLTKSFYLQRTEVTQGQWQKIMGSNPSFFVDCGADCPVERVSWYEVHEFIDNLNEVTGQRYRLPTEAEFEYASRAGSAKAFGNGEISEVACRKDPVLDSMGWYCYNSDEKTHPVARKQANSWGLYDMHGNLWEWCEDSHNDTHNVIDYPVGAVKDPISVNSGDNRVIRGGSWHNDAWFARSGNRDWSKPHYRNDFVGFRLVLEEK